MMDIKISSIQIKCRKRNVFIQLSNAISFIYGNAGVGKTTLLNLISYGLGNDLTKTLAVEQEVLGICLNVLMNGELVSIERKLNSNLMMVIKNDARVSLHAKNKNKSCKQSFSDYLYSIEGIDPIEMLRRKSAQEVKINFSNYMWFSYLKQEELDNTLFYLGDQNNNYKGLASNYVLKALLGEKEVSEKEINREISQLKERRENVKMRLAVMREIYSSTKLLDINMSEEIVKKQKEILKLKDKLNVERKYIDEKLGFGKSSFIGNLLETQKRIGIYEAEIRYLAEFGKISNLRNRYEFELTQSEKEISYFNAIKNDAGNGLFEHNIKKLEKIFLECLLDVDFLYIEPSDHVKIDSRNFLPSVYSNRDEFRCSYFNLSSGGKKTIFKICYALAIHIYAAENEIRSILPRFIIIDTPMKNISERGDKALYENLYHYFVKLFAIGGKLGKMQLIVVDKEIPEIFIENGILCKHMTNQEPLIPLFRER